MQSIETLTLQDDEVARMVIDAEDVACVHPAHSAEHALLVLIKSGYSAIPVVASNGVVAGVISKTMILDRILGLERIEFDSLSNFLVQDVMNVDVPRIRQNQSFIRALQISIDAPFLCVEDDDGQFIGLLARRGILALVHNAIRQTKNPS
ncbi:CBS domain-containing protein [Alicyclobacillus fastidiosus]|uniref:CBS domain-containing protein n=1 Tax=Alicyclobacillus fastidiosus TaxID=392011 RepID=A0ABY6ZC05_9BACL|nr:cyclic-di-AMP-binding protein CbpB [Alicyclobacillus fastidiosus]WAH39635.1 CBS domain-containing protein [Alicyclobacillus fastidiosus]